MAIRRFTTSAEADHSRAPLAALVLGFLYVAGPLLSWTTSLSGEIVAVMLFGVSLAVAVVRVARADVDERSVPFIVPITFLGGMVLMVPPYAPRSTERPS